MHPCQSDLSGVSDCFPLAVAPVSRAAADSGGRQRMRRPDVRHDGTARGRCQQAAPLGAALGAPGELLCSSMASCSSGRRGRSGTGRAGGPCGDYSTVVAAAVAALAAAVWRSMKYGRLFIDRHRQWQQWQQLWEQRWRGRGRRWHGRDMSCSQCQRTTQYTRLVVVGTGAKERTGTITAWGTRLMHTHEKPMQVLASSQLIDHVTAMSQSQSSHGLFSGLQTLHVNVCVCACVVFRNACS